MKNTHDNGIATAATLATLLSCLTIVPLVDGLSWMFAVAVVVVAVAVGGAVVRPLTRWWAVVVLSQLVVILVALTVLFVPDAAIAGVIPGKEAIAALLDLLGEGMRVIGEQSAPVENSRGIQLVLAGGLGGIALVVDLIAVSLRRPAVAGLPLLAVYCLPSAILADGLKWYWFVPAAMGFLALVATDAADRVRAWGRVLGDPERTGERPSGLWLWPATGGGRAAVTAVGLAVIVPAVLPGLGTSLLPGQGFGNSGQSRAGNQIHMVNPILDLRRDLANRSNDVAFVYRTTRPGEPIRLVANESFDGSTWSPSADLPPADNLIEHGLPKAPGLGTTVSADSIHTEVSITTLDQRYLPVSYPPTKITAKGTWLYDPGTFNIVGKGSTTKGMNYSFDFLSVLPKPSQLDAAPSLPADMLTTFTRLPDIPEVIRTTASQVAGSGTSYQRAVRLQNWFRSGGGFTYSIEAPGNGANDAGLETMVAFLDQRTGYCVHFASTMAVMARSIGIPARVAVGFLPGVETDTPGEYAVTYARAHAWPELYFEGTGWVRFEPTPATQTGTVPSWTVPASEVPADEGDTPQAEQQPTTPQEQDQNPADPTAQSDRNVVLTALDAVPWRWVALVTALLLVVSFPRARVAWSRSRRWRRADSRVERAEVGWAELRQRLSDLRVSWPASRTPRSVEALLTGEYMLETEEQAALSRLVSDIESARYAPPWASAGRPATAIQDDVRLVAGAVADSQPRSVRRRARWFPSSAVERSSPQVMRTEGARRRHSLISRR